MNGRTYIVSHCRGSEDSWEVFDDEADAKTEYKRLIERSEYNKEGEDLDLISLSAVVESSDYEPHPAFEPKSAATSFSDALDAYIKETVTKTVNEQLAVSKEYATIQDIRDHIEDLEFVTQEDVDHFIRNEGYITKEDVEECIEDSDFVMKESFEGMLEDCIDQYRFVDRDDVDVMLEDMLEDFMHKEAIEQSVDETVQHEIDVWSDEIKKQTASQVKGLVPDVIKRLINDGQIALTTKTASDPINL